MAPQTPYVKHVNKMNMSYTEKIDVLDMIITILREHEEKIDLLVERLETVADRLDPQDSALAQEHNLKEYLDQRFHDNL